MSATTVGAALDLSKTLVDILAPTISQEQKQSLLNAYKARIASIQAVSDGLVSNPSNRSAQLAVRDLTTGLLNAAGYAAAGVAGINVECPLDDYLQLLNLAAAFVLVIEQNAVTGK
jgi:hypothetical protein